MVWIPGWGLCSTALHKYFYTRVASITQFKHAIKVTKSFVQNLQGVLENSSCLHKEL